MDIRQLRHEQAGKQKLDLKSTVSHMYDLVAGVVVARVCGTPVLGRRSRLGGSLVVESRHLVAEVV